jgi:hypothetical protein
MIDIRVTLKAKRVIALRRGILLSDLLRLENIDYYADAWAFVI